MGKYNLFLPVKLEKEVEKIAKSDASVLISGESGVGKEVVANEIHRLSKFSNKTPVVINLSAIPEELIEKELFGAVKGAFTGADDKSIGKLALADNNTVILDEIANLPLIAQGKIVNFLESGKVYPLGSNDFTIVKSRVIAISNKNLLDLVENGEFRKDLFYRLNVINLDIPPLRERVTFIKNIADSILEKMNTNKKELTFSNDAYNTLISYEWPGNIRELKNVIERAVVLSDNNKISSEYLLLSSANKVNISSATLKEAVDDFKKKYILKVLESNGWNITKSAKILGIQRTYLSRLVKQLYIE